MDAGQIVRTVVVLAGLACIYYAIRLMLRRRAVLQDPVHAKGTIIRLEIVPSDEGPDYFTPTVEYRADDDSTHEGKLTITTDVNAYAVGKRVPIIYQRGDPRNLIDPNFGWAEHVAHLLILTVGLLLVLLGGFAEFVPAK